MREYAESNFQHTMGGKPKMCIRDRSGNMSQCEKIIRYMKDFGSITTMQAFQDLGITRLSGRIYDLKALGYQIRTETVAGRNRYGEKVHYFKYSLEETA